MKDRKLLSEKALPSLFWRIDEGEQSRAMQGATLATYRAEVLRNIRWLLNTPSHREGSPVLDYAEASSSVLNFGLPPFSGQFESFHDADVLADQLRDALRRFEPRIIPDSLVVETVDLLDAGTHRLGFRISGSIWSQPVPERFSMDTSIDTASGEWSFNG